MAGEVFANISSNDVLIRFINQNNHNKYVCWCKDGKSLVIDAKNKTKHNRIGNNLTFYVSFLSIEMSKRLYRIKLPINGEPQFVQSTCRTFAAKSIFKQKHYYYEMNKPFNTNNYYAKHL